MVRTRETPFGIGNREASRLRVGIRGRLTSDRGTQLVELVDLSQSGARLMLGASGEVAEGVLYWGEFEARGRVVWRDNRLCGFQFDEAVPLHWVTKTRSAA